jgi:hypothetical protein
MQKNESQMFSATHMQSMAPSDGVQPTSATD